MRLSREQRAKIERDLAHWGHVARRRWRCEPKRKHPLVRMMELGVSVGPAVYDYEYEPDDWFKSVNMLVMSLPEAPRIALTLHYIDRKPRKIMRKMLGLEHWWQVGKVINEAELMYFEKKDCQPLDKTTGFAIIS